MSRNPNDLGDLLSGLGRLVGGTAELRDPKKDKRRALLEFLQANPQVAQQYRDNPAMLGSVTQQFGNRGKEITDFISQMQMSPLQVEQNRVASLQTREAFNQPGVLNSIANAGDSTALSQIPNSQNLRTVDDASRLTYQLSDVEKEKLGEFRELAGIEKSDKTRRRETAQTANAELENKLAQDAAARQEENKRIASELLAKYGKGIYQAKQKGEISSDQLAAIMAYQPAKDVYEAESDEFWKQAHLEENRRQFNAQRTDVAKNRMDLLAREMVERTNFEISYPEAQQLVHNPNALSKYYNSTTPPTDPNELRLYNAAQTLKRIRDRTSRQELAKLGEQFRRDASQIRNDLNAGRIDAAQAVQQLNEASRVIYGPAGYSGPSFQTGEEVRKWARNRDQIELVETDVEIPNLGFAKGKKSTAAEGTVNPQVEKELERFAALFEADAPEEAKIAAINADPDSPPEIKAEAIKRVKAKKRAK